MIDEFNGAPKAEEPKVTLGGRELILRAGVLSAFEISQARIDPAAIFTMNANEQKAVHFSHMLQLFRAVTAHNFASRKQPVPNIEEYALMIEAEPAERRDALLSEISQKTLEVCYPKLWALTNDMKLRETAPAKGLAN